MRGYFTEGRTPWQAVASDAERSLGADDREGEVPYTLKIRSGCEGGGKGALIQEDKSATLACNNDQYLFQPVGVDVYNTTVTGDVACPLTAEGHTSTGTCPKVMVPIATLEPGIAAREGGHIYEDVSGTLRANAGDNQMSVAYGIDHAITTGGNCTAQGSCVYEDVQGTLKAGGPHAETDKSYTLNATEVHGVAYGFDPGASRDVGVLFIEECGKTLTNGTCPGHHDGVVIATQTAPITASKASFFMNADEDVASTLVATDYKDPQQVCYEEHPIAIDRAYFNQGQNALYDPQTYEDGTTPTLVARGPSAVATHYIVRRLTPTECARLQGFADRWGDVEPKTEFNEEEYLFWSEVRKTSDRINGRAEKDYTPEQMLTWYNKLHTDSAEYKMWGNGIALPCGLFVLQGIKDALVNEQIARSKWLDDLLGGF